MFIGPIVYSLLCGIFGAAFFAMGGLFTFIFPLFLYLSGLRAGTIGTLIASMPILTLLYMHSVPTYTVIGYALFVLLPSIIWVGLFRIRTIDLHILKTTSDHANLVSSYGLPRMINVLIYALMILYFASLLTPDVNDFFYFCYQSLFSLIEKLGAMTHIAALPDVDNHLAEQATEKLTNVYATYTHEIVQKLPGNFVFIFLGWHFLCWIIAIKLLGYVKQFPWKSHPNDQDYALWCDIPFLICLLCQQIGIYLGFSPYAHFMIAFFLALSSVPLLFLGIRIVQIWALSMNLKKKTTNFIIGSCFFLGFPLIFMVILGFMESILSISKRFRHHNR